MLEIKALHLLLFINYNQQEAPLRGQRGRCRNIKGEPQIFGSFPNRRPRPLFLVVVLWWALANSSCVPNLKLLALAVAQILKGNPKILKNPIVQDHVHFSSVWTFMIGLGEPKLCTKFEVAIALTVAEILKGKPLILGAPLAQDHTLFLLWDLMMGLRKPQPHAKCEVAGSIYYGNIRKSVSKRQIRFLSYPFGS